MAKYENPAELDYRNGGDTVDDFAQKYMRTVDYIIKALNDLRTPTGNSAGVEPEPYMWRIADNKLYIRNADNTDYVLLGDISPNFGFRQSVNDRFLTTADLEGEGAVVTRNEAGKVEGDITGSPGKIANKTIDVTPSADNDVIAYDAAQQKWVKKTLNDYLKKQGDAGWDEMVDEVADQVIEDITPIIFNFWYLDDDGYLVPLVGSTEGGLPSIHGMVGDYEQITARSLEVAGNLSATGNVTAGMVTTPQANVTTLTANAVNAGTLTANDIIAKGPVVDVRAFGAVGDGVHDDTQAFRSAISTAEGKTLLVPQGNYLLTEIILADSVSDVVDNGVYADIKPVYPKTEKDIFVKSLDMFKRNGTLKFTNANAQYAQGLGINRTTGNLLIAGVYNSFESCSLYEVATSDVTDILQTYDYTTLGHANTITHCPELNEFIVDDCTDANGTKNYSVINATTMIADPVQKSLTFNHNGICWDPICKVFVAYLGASNYINFYILDKDFNLIKQTRATTTVSTQFINGGCCYNGIFFAPAWDWYGEFSYLDGKQLCLYNEQTYELEDCDMSNDGILYMSVARENNYVEIISCDGNTIFTRSNGFCHETKSVGYTSYEAVNDLTKFSHTGEWYFHNDKGTGERGTTDYPWFGGFLKNMHLDDKVRQIAYRTSSLDPYKNDIAMRSVLGTAWTDWKIGNLSETDCGRTNNIICPNGVVTDYTVNFHREFNKAPIVVVSITTISDYAGISGLNCIVRTNSISKTGFTVRITNTSGGERSPQLNWIAMSV